MRALIVGLLIAVLTSLRADAQTIEGKKIVGGHGYAMYATCTVRRRIQEMQNVPLDGMMLAVDRNDVTGDPLPPRPIDPVPAIRKERRTP